MRIDGEKRRATGKTEAEAKRCEAGFYLVQRRNPTSLCTESASMHNVWMGQTFDKLPDWEFSTREKSPGVYEVKAVRNGSIQRFNEVVAKYGPAFKADKNHTLVPRLGHNVLKTGNPSLLFFPFSWPEALTA